MRSSFFNFSSNIFGINTFLLNNTPKSIWQEADDKFLLVRKGLRALVNNSYEKVANNSKSVDH